MARESIVVENVSKDFTMQYHRTLKQMAVATMRRLPLKETFRAVNDVSFSIPRGETFATRCPAPSYW